MCIRDSIYIDFFGVGEVGYSLFFAAAAAVMAAGPAVWLSASKRGMTVRRFTTLLFVAVICAGAVMAVAGHLRPFLFCGCFAVLALAAASIRPVSYTHLDVYKRQVVCSQGCSDESGTPSTSMVEVPAPSTRAPMATSMFARSTISG